MSIEVTAEKTPEGWFLQTADEFKDILAGPFETDLQCVQAAAELDLILPAPKETKKSRKKRVPNLHIGDLFRVGTSWYRLKGTGEKGCSVEVVGEGWNTTLSNDTEISAVSVLNTQ